MSDTPRTDEFSMPARGLGTGYYQAIDFARKIEREFNTERQQTQRLREALEDARDWISELLPEFSNGGIRLEAIDNAIASTLDENASGLKVTDAKKSEAFERAAQICRYYLKHQQYSSWDRMSEYEKGVHVACENLEKSMLEEVEKPSV